LIRNDAYGINVRASRRRLLLCGCSSRHAVWVQTMNALLSATAVQTAIDAFAVWPHYCAIVCRRRTHIVRSSQFMSLV